MKIRENIEHILLFVVVVVAVSLRLYSIRAPLADWHSWRQSDTSAVSRIYLTNGIDLLYPRYYDISSAQTGRENPQGYRFVEFPLYNIFHVGTYTLLNSFTGENNLIELSGRIVSIIASIVSLLVVFKLGKLYLGMVGGLLSAFFFATLPFNVFYSRTILPEPLSVAFILVSIWFFIRYTVTNTSIDIIVSSFFFSLSILVKPFTIFYGVSILYLAYRKSKSFQQLAKNKQLWIFLLISLTPFVLWRVWISQFPEGIPHMKWAFNSDGIRFRPSFWRWIFGERIGILLLGVGGIVPFVLGFLNEVSSRTKDKLLPVLFVGMLVFLFTFATANVRHDYYQIILVPSIVLLLSSGVVWAVKQKTFHKIATLGLLLFCICLMYVTAWNEVKGYYQINNYSIVKAGQAVDQLVPKDSKVIAPYNKDTAFLYQTNRYGWPFMDGDIKDMIGKGANYYVSVTYDPVTIEIIENYEVVERTTEYVIMKLVD